MKLYLYCSSGTLLEYFTLNKIVCNDYLSNKNRKVIPSLGLVSSKFLFLTPKKLLQVKRSIGFVNDYMEIPAVLELSISDSDATHWPVLAVDSEGNISDAFMMLSDIAEPFMGVFAEGEISFSFVSRIIFDDDNAKDDIYRPSSDLYFPEHLYDVIDDSFSEDMDTDNILTVSEYLNEKYANIDVFSVILKRTKATSITLNTILETKSWPFGENYTANFDAITMNLLGLHDKINYLTNNEEQKIKDIKKDIILSKIKSGKSSKSLAAFFHEFIRELILIYSINFSQSDFQAVIEKVLDKVADIYSESENSFLNKTIKDIEDLVYGFSKNSLESMLESMNETLGVLKALIFFLRSPKSSEKLSDGLMVYKAAPDVRRYAWIMFSALNGIEPISAEKKCNSYVMKISEAVAMQQYPSENIVSIVSSTANIDSGFVPIVEEQLSAECIQDFIMSDSFSSYLPDLIKAFVKNKALSKGFKEKDYMLLKNPSNLIEGWMDKHSTDENISTLELEKLISELQKYAKKSIINYDNKRFLAEYIENKKVFASLYKKDETFWKEVYKRGKKQ